MPDICRLSLIYTKFDVYNLTERTEFEMRLNFLMVSKGMFGFYIPHTFCKDKTKKLKHWFRIENEIQQKYIFGFIQFKCLLAYSFSKQTIF